MPFIRPKLYLQQHPKSFAPAKPSLEYLEKYIEFDPQGFGHSFWVDKRKYHSHNKAGQAEIFVKVKPCWQNDFISMAKFNVARLLIEYKIGAIPKHSSLPSICGLSQCITPSHWDFRFKDPRALPPVLTPDPVFGWCLVDAKDGSPVVDVNVIRINISGIVHVVPVNYGQDLYTLCNERVDPTTAKNVRDETPVTCQKGC